MPHLSVYDPSSIDGEVNARFSADLEWLQEQGITVRRFGYDTEPPAFTEHDVVAVELLRAGEEALPLMIFDGFLASKGSYPDREMGRDLQRPRGKEGRVELRLLGGLLRPNRPDCR